MMNATGYTQMQLITHDTDEISSDAEKTLALTLAQRLEMKPMQYILGHCEFMGLDFEVNENTLIPRPDTEVLVESAIEAIKKHNCKTVLDMCTGSGAIAVSIAKYTGAKVTATDISEKALDVARRNAEKNNVNVNFIKSDLFQNISGKFDIILSNPPYIESAVVDTLDSGVKDYEPRLALDGGDDGLDFYKKIVESAPRFLTNCCGALMFEIGYNQADALKNILCEHQFDKILIKKDLAGLNRVAIGYKIC
jgi:release factor glutamine methyltransferase